jgi:hypothetical protein
MPLRRATEANIRHVGWFALAVLALVLSVGCKPPTEKPAAAQIGGSTDTVRYPAAWGEVISVGGHYSRTVAVRDAAGTVRVFVASPHPPFTVVADTGLAR